MVNERRPWQVTVGQLREALGAAQDDQVVVFTLGPADLQEAQKAVGSGLSLAFDVAVIGGSGPVFRLAAAGPPAD